MYQENIGDNILQNQRANLRRVNTISVADYRYKEVQRSNLSRVYSVKIKNKQSAYNPSLSTKEKTNLKQSKSTECLSKEKTKNGDRAKFSWSTKESVAKYSNQNEFSSSKKLQDETEKPVDIVSLYTGCNTEGNGETDQFNKVSNHGDEWDKNKEKSEERNTVNSYDNDVKKGTQTGRIPTINNKMMHSRRFSCDLENTSLGRQRPNDVIFASHDNLSTKKKSVTKTNHTSPTTENLNNFGMSETKEWKINESKMRKENSASDRKASLPRDGINAMTGTVDREYQMLRENVEMKRQIRELNRDLEDTQEKLKFAKKRIKEMNSILRGKLQNGFNLIDENGQEMMLVLKTKHEILLKNVEDSKKEIETKKKVEEELQKEIRSLQSKLQAVEQKSKEEADTAKEKLKKVESDKKQVEIHLKRVTTEKTKLKNDIETLESKQRSLEGQLKAKNEALKKALLKHDKERKSLHEEINEAAVRHKKEATSLGKVIAESEISIATLDKENEKHKEDVRVLKEAVATLEETISEFTTSNEALKQTLDDKTRDYDVIKTQLVENEQLYREEKKLIFQEAKKFENLLQECDEQLSKREDHCEKLLKKYEDECLKNEQLNEKFDEQTQLLLGRNDVIIELKTKLIKVEDDMHVTTKDLEDKIHEKEENEKHIFELTEHVEELKESLDELQVKKESLEVQSRKNMEEIIEKHRSEISNLHAEQEKIMKENAEKLQKEIQIIESKYENMLKEVENESNEKEKNFLDEIKALKENKEKSMQESNEKMKEIRRLKYEVKRLQPNGKQGWRM